jgi:hypothetical protein
VTEDEVVDGGEEGEFFAVGHVSFGERFETLLHVAHGIEAGGRGEHRDQGPGVAEEEGVGVSGDLHHCSPPAFRHFGQESFAEECVVHDGDEIVFGLDVVVEAHGANVKLLGDPAHGDGVETFLVSDLEGCGSNGFAAEVCVLP